MIKTLKEKIKNLLNGKMSDEKKAGEIIVMEKEVMNNGQGFIVIGAKVIYKYVKGEKNNTLTCKARSTKNPIPERLTTIIKFVFKIVGVGYKYTTLVNNRLKEAGEKDNFVAKDTYTESVLDSNLVLKHKVKDQYYLRLYDDLCKGKPLSIYFDKNLDIIEDDELAQIKSDFLPLPKKSEIVKPRNYKMENILFASYGDFTIEDIDVEELKDLLRDSE